MNYGAGATKPKVDPEAAKRNAKLTEIEKSLTDHMYIDGSAPSKADREAFDALGGVMPNPDVHPNTFAWYAIVSKFRPDLRAKWAATSGAAPAKGGKGAAGGKGGAAGKGGAKGGNADKKQKGGK